MAKRGNIMPKFNLMSYIMPPEDKVFFTLFQDSSEICKNAAKLYAEVLETKLNPQKKEEALKKKKREVGV